MANAIADDENPATRGAWAYADGDWDAERSTREFIAALPAYRAHGLLAVCLNLQGGSPQGYSWNQPWKIGGFAPDGTLKPAWAARLEAVIKACDRLGMVVILGLFYGKQSGTLKDESAVKAAVTNTVDWLLDKAATNVLIEIGNEVDLENVWAHPIIAADRCHELIELAQEARPGETAGEHQPDRARRAAGRHRGRRRLPAAARQPRPRARRTLPAEPARHPPAGRELARQPRPIAASRSSTTRTTISSSTRPTTISSPPSKSARAGASSTTA